MSSEKRVLWTVRHGERIDLIDPKWEQTAPRPWDPHLTDEGKRQARLTGVAINKRGPLKYVISSPFLRCVQTAAAIAAENNNAPVLIEHGFTEWLSKKWYSSPPVYLTENELAEHAPSLDRSYVSKGSAQYGETLADLIKRYETTFHAIAGSDMGGDVAIVTHGYGVYAVVNVVDNSLDVAGADFCSLTRVVKEGDKMEMDLVCDTSHWNESAAERVIRYH